MASVSFTSANRNQSTAGAAYTAQCSLTVTEGTVDSSANTSVVNYSYSVTLGGPSGYTFIGTSRPDAGTLNISINGSNVKNVTVPFNYGTTVGNTIVSGSGSVTVKHGTDGKKTCSFSLGMTTGTAADPRGANPPLYWTTVSASEHSSSITLTNIDPTPSAPTTVRVTDGNDEVFLGEMVEVTWSGATGINISGYEYQRSINGGSWSSSTSTTETDLYVSLPDQTTTIQYRVRAVNGTYYSGWAESNTLTVESNVWDARVLSGTLNTNKYSGDIGLTLQWSATQSVANNTSTISWTLKSNGGGTSSWWNTGPVTVKINGTTVLSITSRFKLYGGGAWSKTGSLTISHNEDGSKSFAASISAAIYSNAVNCTASGTFTLNSIARTPTAPTACSITAGQGSYVGLGDTVTISWSGATGVITGYDLQYSRGSSGWQTFKSVTSGSTSGSTTDSFTSTDITINGAGCAVQYRVRAKNGSLTSGWKTSNTLTISGAMDIKVSGAWKTGSTWIKVNGTWKRAKRIWIKVNGTWQQSK